jgi:hypothetical protein
MIDVVSDRVTPMDRRVESNIPSVQLVSLGAIIAVMAVQASPNWILWAVCLLSIPIAVLLLGGKRAHAVMIFIFCLNWLQVIGAVVVADMSGDILADGGLGPYRVSAIYTSMAALLAVAAGMRLGGGLGRPPQSELKGTPSQLIEERKIRPDRLTIAYVISLASGEILERLSESMPGLTAPLVAVSELKYVFIYLLAATVFETRRGQYWLALVVALELVTGVLGYLGMYQNVIFILMICLASSRARVSGTMVIVGAICAVFIFWMSLVWSVVKIEYRGEMYARPLGERVEWMFRRFFIDPMDYSASVTILARRLSYTDLFALVMSRDEFGLLPADTHLYASAVQHVFTPRILFPNKAELDDTKVTRELTGISVREGTSVGVGYVAEAFADFGFPGMLIPLGIFGLTFGGAVRYFMTRSVSWKVRQACATSAILFTCRFETDIDKAFGGFVTGFLAVLLALKYGYPMIAGWLTEEMVGPSQRGWTRVVR